MMMQRGCLNAMRHMMRSTNTNFIEILNQFYMYEKSYALQQQHVKIDMTNRKVLLAQMLRKKSALVYLSSAKERSVYIIC